ncbi:hypothetical protein CLU79DRAFT_236896 [Phycomyces nitens]|nr:hypothetical protein CLU79DRAFT_236896 [Phycomyces nitens]
MAMAGSRVGLAKEVWRIDKALKGIRKALCAIVCLCVPLSWYQRTFWHRIAPLYLPILLFNHFAGQPMFRPHQWHHSS